MDHIASWKDRSPLIATGPFGKRPYHLWSRPRRPDEPIIQSSDLKRIVFESTVLSAGALGAYGHGMMRLGMGPQAKALRRVCQPEWSSPEW
jgi:Ca2+-transporting ATPase